MSSPRPCSIVRSPARTTSSATEPSRRTPVAVARLGRAMADGLLAACTQPVMKHLPGHGRTGVDSHLAMPRCDEADLAADFAPFVGNADLPWAMTAHMLYSALELGAAGDTFAGGDRTGHPGWIGFRGLLVTDDLAMQALEGPPAARAAAALGAGCDIALFCPGIFEQTASVLAVCPELPARPSARMRAARALAAASRVAARRRGAGRRTGSAAGMNFDITEIAMAVVAGILAITLHEAAHGYAALALGDDTARRAGRLSLNPLRHIDRVGTIIAAGRPDPQPAANAWADHVPVRLGQAGAGVGVEVPRSARGHDAGRDRRAGNELLSRLARRAGPAPSGLRRQRVAGDRLLLPDLFHRLQPRARALQSVADPTARRRPHRRRAAAGCGRRSATRGWSGQGS